MPSENVLCDYLGSALPLRKSVGVFVAVARVAGALQKSTDVMKAMQNLVKIPEIQATMRELSKEMTKVSHPVYHYIVVLCQFNAI